MNRYLRKIINRYRTDASCIGLYDFRNRSRYNTKIYDYSCRQNTLAQTAAPISIKENGIYQNAVGCFQKYNPVGLSVGDVDFSIVVVNFGKNGTSSGFSKIIMFGNATTYRGFYIGYDGSGTIMTCSIWAGGSALIPNKKEIIGVTHKSGTGKFKIYINGNYYTTLTASSWLGFQTGIEMSIFRADFISYHIIPFASFFNRELSGSEVSEISGLLMKAYNI